MYQKGVPAHIWIEKALDEIEATTGSKARAKKIAILFDGISNLPCYIGYIDANAAMVKMTGKFAPVYAEVHANDYKDVEPARLTVARNMHGYWMEKVNEYLVPSIRLVADASKEHGYACFEDFRDGFVPVVLRMQKIFNDNAPSHKDMDMYRALRRQTVYIIEIGERALTLADEDFSDPGKIALAFQGEFDAPEPAPKTNPVRRASPQGPKNG